MRDHRHRVRPGETLSHIALRYLGSASPRTYRALARLNALRDPDLIFPDQEIVIPPTLAALESRLAAGEIVLPSPDPGTLPRAPGGAERALETSAGSGPVILYLPPAASITSGYGPRAAIPEIGVAAHFHPGVDVWWPGCGGYPLRAPLSGRVIQSGDLGNGYGVCVVIDGAAGAVLLAHLAETSLRVCDRVAQGVDVVGRIGSTGLSTGDHLHLEVQPALDGRGWIWGASIDPADRLRLTDTR